jgi:hypothetical protein
MILIGRSDLMKLTIISVAPSVYFPPDRQDDPVPYAKDNLEPCCVNYNQKKVVPREDVNTTLAAQFSNFATMNSRLAEMVRDWQTFDTGAPL